MTIPTIVLRKYEWRYLTGVIVHTDDEKKWALTTFPCYMRGMNANHGDGQIYFFDTQKNG
jgi:hypothetical protein